MVLSRPPASSFPEEWYDLATDDHFWMEWRLQAFLRQLLDLGAPMSAPWKGLDIGCGAGVVCGQLEGRSAWTLDGADLNEKALRLNGPRKGRVLLYDIHDRRPELASAYDFLLLFDVIEHIDDVHGYLDSALYHLRPGGWLFVNVPALEALRSAYDSAAGHLRRYDGGTIAATFSRHALELRDVRYWGASLIPLLLLRTLWTSEGAPVAETLKKGFQPPHPAVNAALRSLCRIETRLTTHPIAGTSLLAAAVKR